MNSDKQYFIRTLAKWVDDDSPLKILEKGRQVGGSDATDYRTVGEGIRSAGNRGTTQIREQPPAPDSLPRPPITGTTA